MEEVGEFYLNPTIDSFRRFYLMAKNKKATKQAEEEDVPSGQAWFDNIWLWFVLSLLLSGLMYNVWGLLELFSI
jgi:hypothetical protein